MRIGTTPVPVDLPYNLAVERGSLLKPGLLGGARCNVNTIVFETDAAALQNNMKEMKSVAYGWFFVRTKYSLSPFHRQQEMKNEIQTESVDVTDCIITPSVHALPARWRVFLQTGLIVSALAALSAALFVLFFPHVLFPEICIPHGGLLFNRTFNGNVQSARSSLSSSFR